MKVAIMQPYFFPYIGYWQLIHAVDRFIVYDDVNYINGGWINRNRLLINGKASFFTIPLQKASQNKLICDLHMQPTISWRNKLAKMIENTYRKTPYFSEIYPTIENILHFDSIFLTDLLVYQIKIISKLLNIKTEIINSSRIYNNNNLTGSDRIIDICKKEGAKTYINAIGGTSLYSEDTFNKNDIKLKFIQPNNIRYTQGKNDFIPWLSIVDVLMHNSFKTTGNVLLKECSLI